MVKLFSCKSKKIIVVNKKYLDQEASIPQSAHGFQSSNTQFIIVLQMDSCYFSGSATLRSVALNHLLFQKKPFDMDPIDLAKLTTFHPLNEPVNFPVENVADEGETFEIPKVQNICSEKKLDSFGSVKSSGRGRGKLNEPLVEDDSFITRELQELSDHRSSFVFSRFNRDSN